MIRLCPIVNTYLHNGYNYNIPVGITAVTSVPVYNSSFISTKIFIKFSSILIPLIYNTFYNYITLSFNSILIIINYII